MSIDTWIRIWRTGFGISLLGSGQFVLCVLISISMYPGGSLADRNSFGYSTTENYLSDLGRTVSISRQENEVGARFFNWSITLMGFCMFPFFLFMPTQASDRVPSLGVAAIFGALACVGLIIIGTCPVDMYPAFHMIGLMMWLMMMFFASSIHAMALLTSQHNPTLLSLLSVAVAMITVSYMYHGTDTAAAIWFHREEIPLQAVFLQKLVGIVALIWFFAFSLKMLLTTDFSDFYERDIKKEAEEYLNEISMNPRRM